ncbi:MAG: peptide chain release factor-like protein [Candidatus Eisenbacteria sp.]|nr:peptide chain release factor-like protein [Candidatus Eisenbacteria bacterium]
MAAKEEEANRRPSGAGETPRKYRTDRYTLERSVVLTTYRSSRPGGQRRDKVETGVRLFHRPSGVTVTASERRSQAQNRRTAFERLKVKLEKLNHRPRPRRPTRRPRAAEERRLTDKARRSQKKRMRKVEDD